MDDVDAEHSRHAGARKGQPLGAAAHDTSPHVRVAVVDRVLGDLEPPHLEPRHHLHEVAHEKALGAADVEHTVARGEPVVRRDVARDGQPAAVVAITAIALLARSVEIFATELARDHAVLGLSKLARGDIALGARILEEQIELSHGSL